MIVSIVFIFYLYLQKEKLVKKRSVIIWKYTMYAAEFEMNTLRNNVNLVNRVTARIYMYGEPTMVWFGLWC